MIKLTYYTWQGVTHSATLEGMGQDTTTEQPVTYYRAWYSRQDGQGYDDNARSQTPDDAAVILADKVGQGIVRIYTEEQPEE